MAGDGVSLPTSLAQMGNVAKTQARGQQSSPQVTPFSEQKDSQEELRTQRVQKTQETDKSRVTRQDEEKDKRRRRRLKRVRKKSAPEEDPKGGGQDDLEAENSDDSPGSPGQENLGSVIDLRV